MKKIASPRFSPERRKSFIKSILIMKLSLILVITCSLQVTAKVFSQNITLSVKSANAEYVFHEIERQTGFGFIYAKEQLADMKPINLNVVRASLTAVLNMVFNDQPLTFTISGNNIVIKEKANSNTESRFVEAPPPVIVTGKITDEDGKPLEGVSVVIKNSNKGITTDRSGRFSIELPSGSEVLVLSYVGYETREIVVAPANTNITVVLKSLNNVLGDLVVIGYGTQKKKDLTGAVASVDVKDTRLQPNASAAQMLRGTVAGVQMTDNGRPGQNGNIVIRGLNSISASNSPLIVLDGIIYAGGNLSDINPNDIESIDILKDASSTAIYGSLAANGVIEITTKKGKSSRPKFSVNAYYGISDYANIPKFLNAEQYLAARKDAEVAEGGAVPFQPIELENIADGKSIDAFREIKQFAPMSNYDMSVAGKFDKVNYFFSGAYTGAKSPIKGDNFSRLSSRLNLSVKATDWLKIGINSGYSSRDNSGARADLLAATYLSPYASLYLGDGVSPRPLPQDVGLVVNPLFDYLLKDNKSITNVLFSNAFAEVNILKGLSYKLNTGYTRTDSKLFNYSKS